MMGSAEQPMAMPRHNWLSTHASNVYSQFGEDGMIAKMFEILPHASFCVEFGAWDGLHHSNTANLIKNHQWSGVLIESNTERYEELCQNYPDQTKVHCLNALVHFAGPNTLDHLLRQTPTPKDFDLLSIDIDGNDYHVWKSLQSYRPKIVVIEFNPSFDDNVEYIQPADLETFRGSSLLALINLAREKRYQLLTTTSDNAFFIDLDLRAHFADILPEPLSFF